MSSKRSSQPRSPAIIGGNDDLLQEILLCLPAKSLIRFQSASKQWLSLISGPSFSRLHTLHHHRRRRQPQPSFLLRSITSQLFFCHPAVKKLVPFRIPFRCRFAGFAYKKIIQSCNGLLLLECWNTPYGTRFYFIYNPTTMKSRKLLPVSFRDSGYHCLMFDPSVSPHYKVLCFRGKYPRYLKVYDSETHSWKDGGETSSGPNKIYDGVYLNGEIYFIRSSAPCYRFRLEDDDFYEISKAPRIRGAENYVMESNGHLHYVVLSLQEDKTDLLHVFEMNKDDYGWFKKYSANLEPISGATTRVVGMIRGEKEEDSAMLLHVPGKIMIYRFCDKIFEVLVDFRRKRFFRDHGLHLGFTECHQFIQTLAPV